LLDQIDSLAKEKQATLSQVALAWLLANPLITSPIVGANSVEQLKDNLGAMNIQLTPAEKNILDKASAWKDHEE
jgi:aryl-alcohol dehydrogenase-like predicted oxidoreductase